jgi:uncharacterized protein YndB with AHSA1/START domain
MALLKEQMLTDSIEIKTSPEKVFDFFFHLVDDESYRAWHPDDHVTFRWIKGHPWEEGSVVYAEEYIHGKLHKLKFVITKLIPNRLIEYAPTSWFLRMYFPKNRFTVEPKEGGCILTAQATIRVGWLIRTFAKKRLERGLSSVRKHMKEEGESLKKILEADTNSHNSTMASDTQ